MKDIKIYQISKDKDVSYRFMSYKFAQEHGFSLRDYTFVYECVRLDNYTKDDCYTEFNVDRPEDFKGHSLSVSDIVEIGDVKWYCDDCGWSEVY